MGRKKVKTKSINPPSPKEREVESKKIITFIPNDSKTKWGKIKGVDGDIVRFKTGDSERQEFLKNKDYTQLYVGVDGNDLYIYYSVK
jgi:hypothetical protein|tara:strand:+ start:155 stop:415 length:261 start_codon:yes stop_codon:yes gene_type:complete